MYHLTCLPLSKFQTWSTVLLAIVTMLYIWTYLRLPNLNFVSFDLPISPSPSLWQPPFYPVLTLLFLPSVALWPTVSPHRSGWNPLILNSSLLELLFATFIKALLSPWLPFLRVTLDLLVPSRTLEWLRDQGSHWAPCSDLASLAILLRSHTGQDRSPPKCLHSALIRSVQVSK